MKTLSCVALLGAVAAFATGYAGIGVWALSVAIVAFLIYHDDMKRRMLSGSDDPEIRDFWKRLAAKWERDH